ncbi:hypothetical protein GCM10025298_25460 [Natronobiforma cellulositropha]
MALVITVLLAPPTAGAGVLTFAVVMVAALSFSYVVGYLETPLETEAYTVSDEPTSGEGPTSASERDREEFRWMVRELAGVAIASAFGLLLLVLFLLQMTAFVEHPVLGTREIEAWAVLAVLALMLVVLGIWSLRGREPIVS